MVSALDTQVVYDDVVKEVRHFMLCCIVENVRLGDAKFREFLQIQTKLHETVCGKREKSTIATHDLAKLPTVNGNFLRYTAKDADQLRIHALGKTKVFSGIELYNELKAEADALRKQKQRNNYSGIHKYLKLLENQRQYACVEDALGNVISLPPLTNGESTKVSRNGTNLFCSSELNLYFWFLFIDFTWNNEHFHRSDKQYIDEGLHGNNGSAAARYGSRWFRW